MSQPSTQALRELSERLKDSTEWVSTPAEIGAEIEALLPALESTRGERQEQPNDSGVYYANCKVCGRPVSAYSYHNCASAAPTERLRELAEDIAHMWCDSETTAGDPDDLAKLICDKLATHEAQQAERIAEAVEFGVEYGVKWMSQREDWPQSWDARFPGIKAQALIEWSNRPEPGQGTSRASRPAPEKGQ